MIFSSVELRVRETRLSKWYKRSVLRLAGSRRLQHSGEEPKCIGAEDFSDLLVGQTALPEETCEFREVAGVAKTLRHRVDRILDVQSQRDVLDSRYRDSM